ncbi:MAG: type IV pilin N-terminal domain-containing protein, partial [Thermoplasmata archaeon]|nr:type IV pilin N-terminal domain-containing protein [Thermoplasmata archaeon]
MKNKTFSDNSYAASEVVGAIILVLIAVGAFAAIYNQVFPVPFPSPESHVQLAGKVTSDYTVILEHVGGEILNSYEIHVTQSNGLRTTGVINELWDIGKPFDLSLT